MNSFEPLITDEMRATYVSRRKTDLKRLENALTTRDYATIAGVAHQIKGNAATFGMEDLALTAVRMEDAAESSNEIEVRSAVETMRDWLSHQ